MGHSKSAREGKPIASPEDTLAVALSLAKIGWPVFPVKLIPVTRQDGTKAVDKRPTVKWTKEATTDLEQVAEWWGGRFSGCWVGVYAEKAGIVVVDLDVAKGDRPDGQMNLRRSGYDLPKPGLRYRTRSNGKHYVYAAPADATLTIGRDHPVKGVDIRAGNGLMVYYGPPLVVAPRLTPAPEWSLIRTEKKKARGLDGEVHVWLERAAGGKPSGDLKAVSRQTPWNDLAHDDMLAVVSELVKRGAEPGARRVFERGREAYLDGRPDRARDWDNAAKGSIGKHGLPPVTIPLTKAERSRNAERNTPEAIETAKREKRVEKAAQRLGGKVADGDQELTDAALAEALTPTLMEEWANVSGVGLLRYDGTAWTPLGDTGEALLVERTRRMLREVRAEATRLAILRADKKREDEAKALEGRGRVVAVARFIAGMLLERRVELDADPDVLNVRNGVVDLRTGKLRERRASDYFTKLAPVDYDPEARSDDWEAALEAMPPKVRDWLQVRFGQGITGRISRDKGVPFLVGGGDNGKSVIIGGMRAAVGSYAATVPDKLLVGADNEHPTDIMVLRGCRFAVFEELPRGGRLNAQRFKLLSGTNMLTGRLMRQDFVTFPATHSLFGGTNHLPIITDVDDAIWARVWPVPLPYKYVDRAPRPGTNERRMDPGLRDRLAETPDPAVLAWLVAGAMRSYRETPRPPKLVRQAWDAWRGEADPVLGFMRDHLELAEGYAVAAMDLYAEFNTYLEQRGQQRWGDPLIASSFAGHSSLPGVVKRQVRYGRSLLASRPIFTTKPIPKMAMSWVGVKFRRNDEHIPSEAEKDAATLAAMERGL